MIPGKLAYAEWYWHQMTEGRDNPKANGVETGTWAYHQKMFGADYAYPEFYAQLGARSALQASSISRYPLFSPPTADLPFS